MKNEAFLVVGLSDRLALKGSTAIGYCCNLTHYTPFCFLCGKKVEKADTTTAYTYPPFIHCLETHVSTPVHIKQVVSIRTAQWCKQCHVFQSRGGFCGECGNPTVEKESEREVEGYVAFSVEEGKANGYTFLESPHRIFSIETEFEEIIFKNGDNPDWALEVYSDYGEVYKIEIIKKGGE